MLFSLTHVYDRRFQIYDKYNNRTDIKSSESDSKVNNVIFITLCSIYSFAFELRNGNGINSMSLASPTLVYHHPHAIGGRPVLH